MESLFSYVAPPSQCGYLPDESWSLEYEMARDLDGPEYRRRLLAGWRRFGAVLFRPRCLTCNQCQALRVDVGRFQPNRSQRRTLVHNQNEVTLQIGCPGVSRAKLDLYDRYHDFQADNKGWPEHPAKDASSYVDSFVRNPAFTEEWCYFVKGRLVGVGYVDRLADSLSAIYFFYEPRQRHRGLGIWNVLCLLEAARHAGLPYVYLGYYVAACPSLAYKANFRPNEVRRPDGSWVDFET